MINIVLKNINVQVPNKTLIHNSDLIISNKHKYGLIGRNGSGKTTLLKFIKDRKFIIPKGEPDIPKDISIYYVQQEIEVSSTKTVLQTILESNIERQKLIEKQEELEKLLEKNMKYLKQYEDISNQLNLMERDESHIKKMLNGLGFTKEQYDWTTDKFSGGWRMRISLACALYMKPDLLLLDEPTNHLDLNATIWLTNHLSKSTDNTLIVISHNIDFLDEICTDIIHLEDQQLSYYKGNYTNFKASYQLKLSAIENEWTKLQKKIKEWKKKGKTKEEIEELMKKNNVRQPLKPYIVKMKFKEVSDLGNKIIDLKNITFGYNEKTLLDQINFSVELKSRITIVGYNGVGKSTFLKLLAGEEIEPDNGDIYKDTRLRIGYYHQHASDKLPQDKTPVEYLASLNPDFTMQEIRASLGTIGLEGNLHNKTINTFSGGQKARVMIAALYATAPHIILFDEPTNHLDIETIEALITAINNFNGGIIIVTHDINLIEKTNCTLYEIKNEKIMKIDYDVYKDRILDEIDNGI
ncbi:MAG: uncharacterized protein Edafosvirus10_27 [Edafosvirus sp.]|uniref:ABC transporter domain-containing protein n=1 Tax=Edafosvirus sp. TaxID=2487765 RepID=A0A3G4ZTX1_9VIRU|nr:MAG: uncharacterized protein Edafosvirus10_27 [Edafosvirus sp.]